VPHFNVNLLHELIVNSKCYPIFEGVQTASKSGVQTASKSLVHIVGYSKSMTAKTVSITFYDRSFKFIGELILEGAQFAPTTFQAFELIVASISIAHFQLVVKFNKLIKLIKAFGHNKIIKLTAFSQNKLVELNNINHSHKLIAVNSNHEGAWAPSVTSNEALRWIVIPRLDRAAPARSICI
jgi:hypothetical protein